MRTVSAISSALCPVQILFAPSNMAPLSNDWRRKTPQNVPKIKKNLISKIKNIFETLIQSCSFSLTYFRKLFFHLNKSFCQHL